MNCEAHEGSSEVLGQLAWDRGGSGDDMKAVAYVRLTADEVRAGYSSCEQQEAEIRDYAAKEGLEITAVYSDDPIGILTSAPNLGAVCSRAGVVNLLDDASIKDWNFVVVVKADRLMRKDMGLDAGTELQRQGKRVVELGEALTLSARKPPKGGAGVVPEKSDISVAERLLRGREAGARAGKHQSGPAPYGYIRDYTDRNSQGVRLQIHPEEANVVRTIFKEYLRRRSMKKLIEHLDSQGLRTRRKKRWSRAGVSWILKNETYLGRVHFGSIRAKGQHPPIISPIIFNKVQKLIRKNNKRGGKDGEGEGEEDFDEAVA